MFENYLEHPDRHPKNAQLLAKYQNDIEKLSEIFTEGDLLHLMTQEQPDGTRKMRPSLASIEIFAPSALLSNYINFFQYTDYLEKWCKLQRKGRCEQVPDMRSCLSSGAMEQGSS